MVVKILKIMEAAYSTKNSENSEWWQMVQRFPGNVSRKPENCRLSETRNVEPKIPGTKFPEIWV